MKITIEGESKEIRDLLNLFIITENIVKPTKRKSGSGRKSHLPLEKIKEIKRMALEGVKGKYIAKRLGVTVDTVKYWRVHTPKELKEVIE